MKTKTRTLAFLLLALLVWGNDLTISDAWARRRRGGGWGGGGSSSTTTTSSGGGGGGGSTTTTTTSSTTTTMGSGSSGGTGTTGQKGRYSIISVGTVNGQTRIVTIEGIRRMTWADYALWSDNNRAIYFKSGETFDGKVHANTELYFSGDPEFFELVTSHSTNFVGTTNSAIFHAGYQLGCPSGTMAVVSFTNLKAQASLIITGTTAITFSGTNMIVSNERRGWTNYSSAIPADAVIYIETATGGTSSTRPGDVSVGGTLDGRITLVTDHDINITNHVRLAADPSTNDASDDALGLISQHNIVVKPSCPDDLEIFAHMMATGLDTTSETDGSFGVENYDSGSPRGDLIVYGGIVQNYRGAVGTFNTGSGSLVSGYDKNYSYDTRFREEPPPHYPPLDNNLEFGVWRDSY